MRKNIIYTLILAVLVFYSCSEDFLNTEPADAISNSLALTNYTNLNKATNGLYAPLRSSDYYGAYMQIAPEVMADNVKRSTVKNSSRYTQEFDLSIAPSVGYWTGLWRTPYYIISASNNIINKINGGDIDKELASDEEINQLLGEALFIRALCHFDLCRLFAHHYTIQDNSLAPGADGNGGQWGIPIITESDISLFPPRNSVNEVFKQVISDLRKAEQVVSFDKGKNFANQNAIRALLAKVYHYQEKSDSALYYSELVINSGEFPLAEGSDVVDYWTQEEGDETIFQVFSNSNENYFPGNESLGSLFNIGAEYPYSDLVITEELYSLYDASDERINLYERDVNNELRTKKFLPKEGYVSAYENNIKILRIAEMYLISAEANLDLGSLSDGVDRMNDLLSARGLADVSTITRSSILLERRKELACEGHRLFDLAIANADNVRPENNATPLVSYPDHRFVLPIYVREIERNENIKDQQNPGY